MRQVSVVGVGMIKFGKYPEKSIPELALPAIVDAIADAGATREQIQAAYFGSVYSGSAVGQRVLKELGMTGIPIVNVENACSSSSAAFREAWVAVAAGIYDVALVVGVEKLTGLGGGPVPLPEEDIEVEQGMVMPALYAMRARRHMHDYGTTIEDLAQIAVKNHRHGALNPHAQYRKEFTLEEIQASRMVADPLTLLHCCPIGDGAAAVIVAASRIAHRFRPKPVHVRASVLTSGRFMQRGRDMTSPEVTVRAAKEAYEMAGVGPGDIDVAELHDAFSIAELLYYEAFGFCSQGEGAKLVRENATTISGRIPVNPSGGLLSKGHPPGASGAAQIAEVVWQLRGEAGDRQVHEPLVGLTHCTGGGVSGLDHAACSIHVLAV